MVDLGMVFVDNWVVGKEKGCYWLSNENRVIGKAMLLYICTLKKKSMFRDQSKLSTHSSKTHGFKINRTKM